MQPTLIRRAQYGLGSEGTRGVEPWRQRVEYETYRSKFGPQYKIAPHFHGLNPTLAQRYGMMTGLFGAAAGVLALFFLSGVPRVRDDIMQNIPFVGGYYRKEVAPEDDPF